MAKKFTRCREDFICEKCGKNVTGDGYTNHCPLCLWGKHVDIYPGDRKSKCSGLMEPISVEVKQGGIVFVIMYKCLGCGTTKKNRSAKNDSFEAILTLSKGAKNE